MIYPGMDSAVFSTCMEVSLMSYILLSLYLFLAFPVAVYLAQDAASRKSNHMLLWIGLSFLAGPLALLLYLNRSRLQQHFSARLEKSGPLSINWTPLLVVLLITIIAAGFPSPTTTAAHPERPAAPVPNEIDTTADYTLTAGTLLAPNLENLLKAYRLQAKQDQSGLAAMQNAGDVRILTEDVHIKASPSFIAKDIAAVTLLDGEHRAEAGYTLAKWLIK